MNTPIASIRGHSTTIDQIWNENIQEFDNALETRTRELCSFFVLHSPSLAVSDATVSSSSETVCVFPKINTLVGDYYLKKKNNNILELQRSSH